MDDINVDCKYGEDIQINIKKAEDILANGNFKFKTWIKSGDCGEKSLDGDSIAKSLGLYWKTEKDLLCSWAVPGGGPQGHGPPQSAKILKQIWPHFGQHPLPH